MADIDTMPSRGVPFRAQVGPTGIALSGTMTIEQLAQRGMRPVCIVDNAGLNAGVTVEQLAQRGIRAACLVDENGLASGVSADELRRRGIRPIVQLTAAGLSGSTTTLQLAQRGLDYACLVDETGAAAGGAASATWDPATVTLVTLSGGNLIATNTGTDDGHQGVRVAAASGKSSGKYYFELKFTNLANTGSNIRTCLGFTMAGTTYGDVSSSATNSFTFNQLGNITCNGTGRASFGQRASGDVIGIAVDFTNQKAWFRVAPSGLWNNTGGHDPATNTGGSALAPLTGALVPVCAFGGLVGMAGNIITANFGASAFTGAVPSGFTSGWTQ